MKNQEKFHLCFLNNVLLIFFFNVLLSTLSLSQSPIIYLQNEYASSLFSLGDYISSSTIFNQNIDSSFNQEIMIFPVVANYKVNNTIYRNLWINKMINYNYRSNDIELLNNCNISNQEIKDILYIIDSIYNENIGKIVKKIDFDLEDKISSMLALDQFPRINYIAKEIWEIIDSQYIFADIMDLMLSDIDGKQLSQNSKSAIYIMLIHQADYVKQFNKMHKLKLIKKMLKKNVISPFEYASIYDRNFIARKEKIKFGTLYTWGNYDIIDELDLVGINKNRLKIGLCELQYDYRNSIPLISNESELKKEVLLKIKKLKNNVKRQHNYY